MKSRAKKFARLNAALTAGYPDSPEQITAAAYTGSHPALPVSP
jgi:hypothetical protein